MIRLAAAALLLLVSISCGDDGPATLTGPTSISKQALGSPVRPTGLPTTQPDAVITLVEGPVGCCFESSNFGTTIRWVFTGVPKDWEFDKAFDWTDDFHNQEVNTGGKHTNTTNSSLRYFFEGDRFVVELDLFKVAKCGTVQADVNAKHNGKLLVHTVFWLPPCEPETKVGSCPTDILSGDLKEGLHKDNLGKPKPGYLTWIFINTAHTPIGVVLASFTHAPNAVSTPPWFIFLPQYLFDWSSKVSTGGHDFLTIRIPYSHGQGDAACGSEAPPDVLDASNDQLWENRIIAPLWVGDVGYGWTNRPVRKGNNGGKF